MPDNALYLDYLYLFLAVLICLFSLLLMAVVHLYISIAV